MATTRKPQVKPATAAVQRYRARQEKEGGATVYCTVSKEAAKALDSIVLRRICTKREAVELALRGYARELARRG